MSDNHLYARVVQTGFAPPTWQVYTLFLTERDGSASYARWPKGKVVWFESKAAAQKKADQLTKEVDHGSY